MTKQIIALLFFLMTACTSHAQLSIRDTTIAFPMIGATFNYELPGGDLSKRFGNNYAIGGVFQWKLQSNWIIGIEGSFIFSDDVRENHILDNFKTADGNIIDGSGQYGLVLLYERGLKFMLKGGKIFPLFGPNKNSGLLTTVGAGYLQHRIKIDTPGSPIPYLEGEYLKGYDRLTNGFAVTEFIGYLYFGNKRLVNFFAGLECTQGFTKGRRAMNFDTGLTDHANRTDLLFGFRAGWVFPLYKRAADKFYTN